MLDEKSGMFRNKWHEMGALEVCREFFPDGKPAGLAIRMKKGEKSITHEKGCWLNNLGVQNMIGILLGETKYVGPQMLRSSDPHRFCKSDLAPGSEVKKE